MKRRPAKIWMPFIYLFYFLHPRLTGRVLRNAYFSTFSRETSGDDLRIDNLLPTNVHITYLGGILSVALYYLLPLVGLSFRIAPALRVFLGFIAAFGLYATIGHLQSRLRNGGASKPGRGVTSGLLFFSAPAAIAGGLVAGVTGQAF